jgi:streptogramin lyase
MVRFVCDYLTNTIKISKIPKGFIIAGIPTLARGSIRAIYGRYLPQVDPSRTVAAPLILEIKTAQKNMRYVACNLQLQMDGFIGDI